MKLLLLLGLSVLASAPSAQPIPVGKPLSGDVCEFAPADLKAMAAGRELQYEYELVSEEFPQGRRIDGDELRSLWTSQLKSRCEGSIALNGRRFSKEEVSVCRQFQALEYELANATLSEKQRSLKQAAWLDLRPSYIDIRHRCDAWRSSLPGARLGMSAKQVTEQTSWGYPKEINRSTGSWGVHEQWIYGSHNYLYFKNGVLSSIQN